MRTSLLNPTAILVLVLIACFCVAQTQPTPQSAGTVLRLRVRVKVGDTTRGLSRKRFFLIKGSLEQNKTLVDEMLQRPFISRDCYYRGAGASERTTMECAAYGNRAYFARASSTIAHHLGGYRQVSYAADVAGRG